MKSSDQRRAIASEATNSTAMASKEIRVPNHWAAAPQTIPPTAMAPCDSMMTAALTRPLAHGAIARCAASQSSEADRVQAAPATPATSKQNGLWVDERHPKVNGREQRASGKRQVVGREMPARPAVQNEATQDRAGTHAGKE